MLTFAGGAEAIRTLHNRSRSKAENHRDTAVAESAVSSAALALLGPYRQEVVELRHKVDAIQLEREADRHEQSRISALLHHAIEVIRDCIDVMHQHDIPAPTMSAELLAEIERST
ncbi:hypothetical protein [Nocardia sp. NPDC051570]|uniref:hypothetical protein n=1 Tax=Nocardia sp. NPDC051570 TaxID=3364324 RepID=UPI00378B63CE